MRFSKHAFAAIAAFALVTVHGAQETKESLGDQKSNEADPSIQSGDFQPGAPGYAPGAAAPPAPPMIGQPGRHGEEEHKTPRDYDFDASGNGERKSDYDPSYHREFRNRSPRPRRQRRRGSRSPARPNHGGFIQNPMQQPGAPGAPQHIGHEKKPETLEDLKNEWCEGIHDDTPVWYWIKVKRGISQNRIYDPETAGNLERNHQQHYTPTIILQNTSKDKTKMYCVKCRNYDNGFYYQTGDETDPYELRSRSDSPSQYDVRRRTFGELRDQEKLQFALVKATGSTVFFLLEEFIALGKGKDLTGFN